MPRHRSWALGGPLVMLLLVACSMDLRPTPTLAPASPSPTASPIPSSPTQSPSPTPTPAPTSPPLAVDSVVQVVGDGLRIHNAPAEDATSVAILQAGQRVVIVDGPQAQGGFDWYQVSRGRDATRGWVAAGTRDEPWLRTVANGRIAMRYRDAERVGIGLVNADGTDLVVLEGNPGRLEWARDGSRLAFSMGNPLQPGEAPDVFVMQANGSERHRIGQGSDFAWSPDGSRLAIAEERRIILHDPSTGQDIGRLPLPLTSVSEMTWSPDGSALALTAAGTNDGRDVYVVASDTGRLARLSQSGINASPAWSPSGKRLVFNSPEGVVISDPAGSDERKLSDGAVSRPWSPDGIFLLIDRYAGLDLFDLRLQGSQTVARDNPPSTVAGGAWAPDGSAIVYQRLNPAAPQVQTFVSNRDGTGAVPLPGSSDLAVWQPLLGD